MMMTMMIKDVTMMWQWSVILLQIVIVSPGTHLVKNCESQSRTIESEFKKQWLPDDYQIIDIWDDHDGKSMW